MNEAASECKLSSHERVFQDLHTPGRRQVVSGVEFRSASNPRDNGCHRPKSSAQKPTIRRGLTFWLFIPTVLLIVTLFAAFCHNVIPWWLNWVLASPLYYFIVICGHDAFHGSAHANRRSNNLVGWIASLMFAIPFSMARQAHLRHHSRTGTDDDIERHGYHLGITLPFRILVGNWLYYLHLPKCKRRVWVMAVATVTATIATWIAWPAEVFLGWFLPMQSAAYYVAITAVWMPHGRYSRWIMDSIPFITLFHEEHHAQPNYPFHQIMQRQVRSHIWC